MENLRASELRIGNWYQSNNGITAQVQAEDYMNWHVNGCWANPIPITEEWLLKFNPSACANAAYLFESEIGGVWIEKFIDDKYYLTDDEANMLSFIEIKYVHQLQNIYHSLTGEELAITTQ
jgi:hypothetical protein